MHPLRVRVEMVLDNLAQPDYLERCKEEEGDLEAELGSEDKEPLAPGVRGGPNRGELAEGQNLNPIERQLDVNKSGYAADVGLPS